MPDRFTVPIEARTLLRILPHRFPFLLIDRVVELEPGVRAVGWKCVAANEPWFQGHFPASPVMPGVLISEAFAQLACVLAMSEDTAQAGREVYLLGLDKMRFRRPVTPGDRLVLEVTKDSVRRGMWRFQAVAKVEGERVADGSLLATVAGGDQDETVPST